LNNFELPKHRQRSLRAWLRERGSSLRGITAADKLSWLASVVDERPPISWRTLSWYGRCLALVGPKDATEGYRQRLIVRAFVSELKNCRRLAPQRRPSRVMPRAVFERLLRETECNVRPKDIASRVRLRLLLKLAWRVGLTLREAVLIRRGWLKRTKNGYLLRFPDRRPARATLAIPRSNDPKLCAVRELDRWLRLLPPVPQTFVFCRIDRLGRFRTDAPLLRYDFHQRLRHHLGRVGETQYAFSSVRRSFLHRSREQFGEAVTHYLAGFVDPRSLNNALRAEPNFSAIKPAL
jgi:hypothetical protein